MRTSSSSFAYRPELDGLRAVAVLSVLFFHAGFSAVSGGFVGVDIFFVLSGYLITSILIKEITAQTFSFSGFYERRIRRLLPPLVPVLALTSTAAFIFLDTSPFLSYIDSLYSTLALSANWNFLATVGYFDGPGERTPLLHMWSLAIEEQFYLIFPIVLLFSIRIAPHKLPTICFQLLVLSFAVSVFFVYTGQQEHAFYNSFARFWELLVGAFLASIQGHLKPNKTIADILEAAGVVLLITGIFLYAADTPFPGPSAIPPTLGTALIIAAAGNGRVVSPLLKFPAIVWFGLISYSLYLWHWPLFVFLKYLHPINSPYVMCGAIFFAVALSSASYYWLEVPIRSKRFVPGRQALFGLGLASVAGLAALGTASLTEAVEEKRSSLNLWARNGLYNDERAKALATIETAKQHYLDTLNKNYNGASPHFDLTVHKNYTCSFDQRNSQDRVLNCLMQQAKHSNILLIGDSIGRDTLHALRRAYPESHFIMMHHSGCPPAEVYHQSKKVICFPKLTETVEKLAAKFSVDGIVLNFRYRPKSWEPIRDSIPLLKGVTKNIVLMGVTPVFRQPVDKYLKALPEVGQLPKSVRMENKEMVGWSFAAIATKAREIAIQNDILFADVTDFFCTTTDCRLWTDGSLNWPLFWDNQHITEQGIESYARYLRMKAEMRQLFSAANLIVGPH